jgi:hypothetical protein
VQDRLVVWEIAVENEAWHQLLLQPDSYVLARVTVDGKLYDEVGLRLLGDPNHDKKSMRIQFDFVDPDQEFHNVKHINLLGDSGDPTLLRAAMALELFAGGSVPAPRHSFVRVTGVGGDAGGVYTLVEQVDRKFLRDRFGEDAGHLFKLETGASLAYLGDAGSSYDQAVYELEIGDAATGYQLLADFIKALNQTPAEALEKTMESMLDLDGFLRALAINSWLSNMDSYPGAGGNLYFYRDTDGRFHYIPWDLNQAFGNYHGAPCNYTTDQLLQLDPDNPACGNDRPLVARLLAVPSIRSRYHSRMSELLAGVLQPAAVIASLRGLHERIQEAAHKDTLKGFTNAEFDAALSTDLPSADAPKRTPALEPFIVQRDVVFRNLLGN